MPAVRARPPWHGAPGRRAWCEARRPRPGDSGEGADLPRPERPGNRAARGSRRAPPGRRPRITHRRRVGGALNLRDQASGHPLGRSAVAASSRGEAPSATRITALVASKVRHRCCRRASDARRGPAPGEAALELADSRASRRSSKRRCRASRAEPTGNTARQAVTARIRAGLGASAGRADEPAGPRPNNIGRASPAPPASAETEAIAAPRPEPTLSPNASKLSVRCAGCPSRRPMEDTGASAGMSHGFYCPGPGGCPRRQEQLLPCRRSPARRTLNLLAFGLSVGALVAARRSLPVSATAGGAGLPPPQCFGLVPAGSSRSSPRSARPS